MKHGVDISITVNTTPLWNWLPSFHLADAWLMVYWLKIHVGVSVRRWR